MSAALKQSIFGDQGGVRELAALSVPTEGTGDKQVDQSIAAANVGELFWYTLPQLRLEMETLEAAYAKASIDRRYLPGKIQAADAFRRATSGLQQSAEAEMNGQTVRINLLVRDVGSDKARAVRQAVLEVRDAAHARLVYTPAGQFELQKAGGHGAAHELGEIRDLPAKAQDLVREALDAFPQAFADAMHLLDDGHVRRAVDAMMAAEHVISLRPSGGVYFALQHRGAVVGQLDLLFEALAAAAAGARFVSVPVIDVARQRQMLAEATLAHVRGEVESLVREMDGILTEERSGRKVRGATAQGYLQELKRLTELVGEYRAATRDRLSEASASLELLKIQVTALLTVAA